MKRIGVLCLILAGGPLVLWGHSNHHAEHSRSSRDGGPSRPAGVAVAARAEARLSVTIADAKRGRPTPARVRITDRNGRPLGLDRIPTIPIPWADDEVLLAVPGSVIGLPAEAIGVMYGKNDLAQGYAFQPDGSFYVNGSFDMPMPAGDYFITISKGYEFVRERDALTLEPGDHLTRNYALRRWIDMPERGWYSADDHIHIRRSPRENPLLLDWIAAEDVHVGVLLQMGDFWTTYFSQYGWGKKGLHEADRYVLTSGQEEPRTPELGHTISFGAEQFVRFRNDYYSYDRVFDRVHALGGVSGYAHQAMSFHGYRGMTLDVLAGKIDFLELLQFCVQEGPLVLDHYYRFLDLGYKLTALAGSDFPWCGRDGRRRSGEEQVGPQIGDARFYTYTGDSFSFDQWLNGVKAGNTFVTSGPMLELEVNGQLPGSHIDLKPGEKLRVSATAYGHPEQIPLQRLQLIGHGKVLAEARPPASGEPSAELTIEHEIIPEHGIWIAVRADAGVSQTAHTTPVYVTVNGDGFHNRSNLASQIELSREYLQQIRALLNPAVGGGDQQQGRTSPAPSSYRGARERLEQRIVEAERKLDELILRR